jgi:hypothetical protein
MLVANHRRHAHPTIATPSHSRPIATGSPHRRLPTSTFLRSLSAPPRSLPTAPTTTFVRASRQTTILVRASDPVPTLPSCVLSFPRHTTASPGPPSLAARLWRSFDGGVGKERTSKAIASPRAQERIEPVACRQKSSRLSINPHPTRGSPARSFEPHSKVCQEIRSKRFGVDANCPSRLPKGKPPKANSHRRSSKAPQRVNPIARPVSSPVSHAGSMEVSGLPKGQPQDRAARPRVP